MAERQPGQRRRSQTAGQSGSLRPADVAAIASGQSPKPISIAQAGGGTGIRAHQTRSRVSTVSAARRKQSRHRVEPFMHGSQLTQVGRSCNMRYDTLLLKETMWPKQTTASDLKKSLRRSGLSPSAIPACLRYLDGLLAQEGWLRRRRRRGSRSSSKTVSNKFAKFRMSEY